jgi:hypothetical protein
MGTLIWLSICAHEVLEQTCRTTWETTLILCKRPKQCREAPETTQGSARNNPGKRPKQPGEVPETTQGEAPETTWGSARNNPGKGPKQPREAPETTRGSARNNGGRRPKQPRGSARNNPGKGPKQPREAPETTRGRARNNPGKRPKRRRPKRAHPEDGTEPVTLEEHVLTYNCWCERDEPNAWVGWWYGQRVRYPFSARGAPPQKLAG